MIEEQLISSVSMWPIIINDNFEMFSIHEINLKRGAINSLHPVQEKVITSCLITSVLVGSYCTISIYHYMFAKYKNKSHTLIDILILVSTITQHLTSLFIIGLLVVGMSFDITYSEYVGELVCELIWYSTIYSGAYRTFGSLGIAIYRVLLLKANYWIQKYDQKKVIAAVLICSIAVTTFVTIGFGTGNGPGSRKRVVWNWCKGKNEELIQVVQNYALIRGTISNESEEPAKLCLFATLLGCFAELGCYLIFFGYLYSHDKGLFGRKVLKETEFLRRRRKNCMSFMVQFYGFIVECLIIIGMGLGMSQGSNIAARVVVTFGVWMEFGINALVQVMSSQILKEHLPHNRYLR